MNPLQYERLEQMARDVGAIRWRTTDETIRWTAKRLSEQMWWLLAWNRPTAADLVRQGWDVDEALEEADRETERMNRLVGRC